MARMIKKRSKKDGLPPGTLVHIGERKIEKVKITIIDYDETHFQQQEVSAVEECFPFKDKPTVTSINIDGIHQVDVIEQIGKHFDLHPLILEDIVNTGQRPKYEDFGHYLFLVLKMLFCEGENCRIEPEQVSVILGKNFVISFQEREGDVFNPIRERIKNARGRIRKMRADYLAYALVDSVIDSYFGILESIGENIEKAEEALLGNPTPHILHQIHALKREMIFLRKSVWPLREVISGLERGESSLIQKSSRIYLRDVYDHTIQVIDTIETFRDVLSGMLDLYLSSISNKMNEVMKVLTIFASIFIPLTFIAGVYGMNFKYIPELEWSWGYPLVWGIMLIVTIVMVSYFRRKKWF